MNEPLDQQQHQLDNSHATHLKETEMNIDVHQALRALITLQPTEEIIADTAIVWQRANAAIHQVIAANPSIHAHVHGTDQYNAESEVVEKGLVLLFHGCTHEAQHWFMLPEERRIVRFFLASGYSVLAFSSLDRSSGCWDNQWPIRSSIQNADAQRVIAALSAWLLREYTAAGQRYPALFTMGASSGGTFTSIISRTLPIIAQVIQISTGHDAALLTVSTKPILSLPSAQQISADTFTASVLTATDTLYPVPPTMFLHMSKDMHWASLSAINSMKNRMKEKGKKLGLRMSRTDSISNIHLTPPALTKSFLAERIDAFYPALSSSAASAAASVSVSASSSASSASSDSFFRACHLDGFIDRYGYLNDNPRNSGMLTYLQEKYLQATTESEHSEPGLGSLIKAHYAEIEEELNVLWGEHELTSAQIEEVTWWMEKQRAAR